MEMRQRENNPTKEQKTVEGHQRTGLQHSKKFPHPEAGFSWPLNVICNSWVKINVTAYSKTIIKLKFKNILD